MNFTWRQLLLKQIILRVSEDRMIALKFTSLSHTPGTEQGANKLQDAFRQEMNMLKRLIEFASDIYMKYPKSIEEMPDEEEGTMRFVE